MTLTEVELSKFNRSWHKQVLDEVPECTEMDPSYFFADPNDDEEPHGNSERVIAISACNRCFLKTACFQYAIVNDIESGVWGGSVPAQRSAYRERMRDSQHTRLFGSAI